MGSGSVMVTATVVRGENTMADPDLPEVQVDYDISVKVPQERGGKTVRQYLAEIADQINASEDDVNIVPVKDDDADSSDASGGWKDATLSIYVPTLGCGTKKSDPDFVDELP
jgi:hypothetical protein